MEKATNNECREISETLMSNFDWFNTDTPLEKGFDEFCKSWWVYKEKENASNGGWNDYKTYEEWKLMELEKSKPKHDNHECIGKYELMIDDHDFDYMCDYLLSNDGPFFMNEEKERVDEGKYKLVGTPQDRMKNLGEEYDEWVRTKGWTLLNENDDFGRADHRTDNDVKIELSEEFLMELRSNAYCGTDDEDVGNGSWNEEPMDDIVSSDKEWEESDYGNPPNTNCRILRSFHRLITRSIAGTFKKCRVYKLQALDRKATGTVPDRSFRVIFKSPRPFGEQDLTIATIVNVFPF
ncbi:hypothetical protein Tco_1272207 [Tanacetum coccineum]